MLRSTTKRRLGRTLRLFGLGRVIEFSLVRWTRWAVDSATYTPNVLTRTIALAGPIRTVIDIGASDGRWVRRVRPLLPNAKYLLFEANATHYRALHNFAEGDGAIAVEYAAASNGPGFINFYVDSDNPLGGAASASQFSEHNATVSCMSIDDSVAAHGLEGPFLLKLDTQGHEPEILAGAAGVIAKASLVIIEAYGVSDDNRMSFDELCVHMRALGFRAAGIADPTARPSDGMFWQMDMFFIREDHDSFRDHFFH